jgi:hypothetical protein
MPAVVCIYIYLLILHIIPHLVVFTCNSHISSGNDRLIATGFYRYYRLAGLPVLAGKVYIIPILLCRQICDKGQQGNQYNQFCCFHIRPSLFIINHRLTVLSTIEILLEANGLITKR